MERNNVCGELGGEVNLLTLSNLTFAILEIHYDLTCYFKNTGAIEFFYINFISKKS